MHVHIKIAFFVSTVYEIEFYHEKHNGPTFMLDIFTCSVFSRDV